MQSRTLRNFQQRNLPKAASSVELPWPITAVEMRLIKGPQTQSPVAGPENIIISFIWLHMLWFANSSLFDRTTSGTTSSEDETVSTLPSLSVAVSRLSSTNSWLWLLMQAVTNRLSPFLAGERRILGELIERWRRFDKNWLLTKIEAWQRRRRLGFRIGVWEGRAKVLSCIFQLGIEAKKSGYWERERESKRGS